MMNLLSVAAELALFAGAFVLQFLFILLFRNPKYSARLRSMGADTLTAVGMSALLSISFGLFFAGVVSMGLSLPIASAIAVALGIATPMLLWRLMKMRARLDACALGRSPFDPVDDGLVSAVDRGAIGPA
jgi:hypothetical protein